MVQQRMFYEPTAPSPCIVRRDAPHSVRLRRSPPHTHVLPSFVAALLAGHFAHGYYFAQVRFKGSAAYCRRRRSTSGELPALSLLAPSPCIVRRGAPHSARLRRSPPLTRELPTSSLRYSQVTSPEIKVLAPCSSTRNFHRGSFFLTLPRSVAFNVGDSSHLNQSFS
jgi:hypothetical protein